jgi:uncharacterized protein YfbU (UPF0304 family)
MSLEHYRQMLRTWRRLGENSELTASEIEEIAEGR